MAATARSDSLYSIARTKPAARVPLAPVSSLLERAGVIDSAAGDSGTQAAVESNHRGSEAIDLR
ncbi:MAG: hypothetical protein R2733_20095 [Acidimicrobiales bacterium]